SSSRPHTYLQDYWSSDVCSTDLPIAVNGPTTVNITLTASGSINGWVHSATGAIVTNASVQAYQAGPGATCCTFVTGASSDAAGRSEERRVGNECRPRMNTPSGNP